MAKSLRSKRMRKMRAVKREKNAVKELVKLRAVLALDKTGQEDFPMKDLVQVTTSKALINSEEGTTGASKDGEMDVDPKYNKKNFKDENGQYPEWMNQRMMRKQKSKNIKRIKGKKRKESKKK